MNKNKFILVAFIGALGFINPVQAVAESFVLPVYDPVQVAAYYQYGAQNKKEAEDIKYIDDILKRVRESIEGPVNEDNHVTDSGLKEQIERDLEKRKNVKVGTEKISATIKESAFDYIKETILDKANELPENTFAPPMPNYNKAVEYIKKTYFYDSNNTGPYNDLTEEDAIKKIATEREKYLYTLAIHSFAFGASVYDKLTGKNGDGATLSVGEIGGDSLKADLEKSLEIYRMLCDNLIADLVIQLRLLELETAYALNGSNIFLIQKPEPIEQDIDFRSGEEVSQ